MAQYRKKPVVIETLQWLATIESEEEIAKFTKNKVLSDGDPDFLWIQTLEGEMRASPFDFIIKGVNGEFYPCKPDIFEKTYEIVD